jgi:hypothetical protein
MDFNLSGYPGAIRSAEVIHGCRPAFPNMWVVLVEIPSIGD